MKRLGHCTAGDQTAPNRSMKPLNTAHPFNDSPTVFLAIAFSAGALILFGSAKVQAETYMQLEPYQLDTSLLSRSISFENVTGEPGAGGKAASNLGVGRKGAPARDIKPGETVE